MKQEPLLPADPCNPPSDDTTEKPSPVSRRGFLQKFGDGCGLVAVSAIAGASAAPIHAKPEAAKGVAVPPPVSAGPGKAFKANNESPFRFQRGVKGGWVNFKTGGVPETEMMQKLKQLQPGGREVIAIVDGPGVIDRLWLTFNWPGKTDRYPNSMLRNRGVIVEIFWDGAEKPAVSAPIGDLFGHHLGYSIPFESALFADPSGRCFNTVIPMPFKKQARIEIINGFDKPVTIFPEIKFRTGVNLDEDDCYFHAHWERSVGIDMKAGHTVLPQVNGRGRYLGTQMGIISNPKRKNAAWHGGDLNWFLDEAPEKTLISTTLDDYCGSAWDYDMLYTHQEAGLLFSKYFEEGGGHHGLYCYHLRDLIQFERSCRVNQHRHSATDDVSTTALFYLDRPEGIAASCFTNMNRLTPAHHWPLEDGTV